MESTGPTVNIQTTEPECTTAETKAAEGESDYVNVLEEDPSGDSSGDPTDACVIESVECASVDQLLATDTGSDHDGKVSEKTEEVEESEGREDADLEEVVKSEDSESSFRFIVAPAVISEREETQPPEEEQREGEAAESCSEEVGFENHTEQSEVDGKRVQFSEEVQYFQGQDIPSELEETIEEAEEDRDEGGQKVTSEPLPFEKERYHHPMTDSSEDEAEGAKEEQHVDEETEEFVKVEDVNEEPKAEEEVEKSRPQEETEAPTSACDDLEPSPVSKLEVTPRQLQWPPPQSCNFTCS